MRVAASVWKHSQRNFETARPSDFAKAGMRKAALTKKTAPATPRKVEGKPSQAQGAGGLDGRALMLVRQAFEGNMPTYNQGMINDPDVLDRWSRRVADALIQSGGDRELAMREHLERMEKVADMTMKLSTRGQAGERQINEADYFVVQAWKDLAELKTAEGARPTMAGRGGMGGVEQAGGARGPIGFGGVGMSDEESEAIKKRIHQAKRLEIVKLSARLAAKDNSPADASILRRLNEPVTMSFANETPLEDVLKYIKSATQGPKDSGIPIYVDPEGLKDAGVTLTSPVMLDVEGVPVRVTLRLMLKQLKLAYCVKDGLLMISSVDGIQNELEEAVGEEN